jgi:hypothetical protein
MARHNTLSCRTLFLLFWQCVRGKSRDRKRCKSGRRRCSIILPTSPTQKEAEYEAGSGHGRECRREVSERTWRKSVA